MTYRRPGPACRPRPGRTPRRPGPATVIELLAGAGLAAGSDPAPGKRGPAARAAAPPTPIGLTAAALSAGAEGKGRFASCTSTWHVDLCSLPRGQIGP